MSACRGCGAPVLWAVTPAGRTIPLDAEPSADGNVILTGHRVPSKHGSWAPEARVLTNAQLAVAPDDVPTYTAHFARCPKADELRQR